MTENTAPETTAVETETVAVEAQCQCSRWVTRTSDEDAEIPTYDGLRCGRTTTNLFAPGHDARLKGQLIRWGALDLLVTDSVSSETWSASFVAHTYGFGHMVDAGIALAKAKAEARQAKADAKHEAKAAKAAKASPAAEDDTNPLAHEENEDLDDAPEAQVEEPAVEVEPLPVPVQTKAKIGRWTYEGTVNVDGTFTYNAKLGGTKIAEAGTFQVLDA